MFPTLGHMPIDQIKGKDILAWALLHKPICKGFFSDIIFK